jgi:hypothetical protein
LGSTIEIGSFLLFVTLPKVAKAKKEGDMAGIILLNFPNVNTALRRSKLQYSYGYEHSIK